MFSWREGEREDSKHQLKGQPLSTDPMYRETLTLTATEAWGLHPLGERKVPISNRAGLQPRESNKLARALNIIQAGILRQARKEADSKPCSEEAEETTSWFLQQAKFIQAPVQRNYHCHSHLLPPPVHSPPCDLRLFRVVESSSLWNLYLSSMLPSQYLLFHNSFAT